LFSAEVPYFVEALVLVIFVLYVVLKGPRPESISLEALKKAGIDERQFSNAIESEKRFFSYWPVAWVLWFFLYVALGTESAVSKSDLPPYVMALYPVLSNVLNSATCIPFVGMYYELSENTTECPSKFVAQRRWFWFLLSFIAVTAAIESGLRVFLPDAATEAGYWASLISGCLVGVCIGLFVFKLLSLRLFDLPLWTILLLTLYVVVQPVFPAVTAPADDRVGYALVLVALYAKIVLLVVVEWMRDTYRILYFMLRSAEISDDGKVHEEFAQTATDAFGPPTGPSEIFKKLFAPAAGIVFLAVFVTELVEIAKGESPSLLKQAMPFIEAFCLAAFAFYAVFKGDREEKPHLERQFR
ncbi:MAG TPA: hypothetical protein VFT30_05260, partial [Nitrospira sp.]|nr:hypothetical protein [Nitrospira sp.]